MRTIPKEVEKKNMEKKSYILRNHSSWRLVIYFYFFLLEKKTTKTIEPRAVEGTVSFLLCMLNAYKYDQFSNGSHSPIFKLC